jgi:hypothetical protein
VLQVSQHLEEVKYLNGEILRLKDKVALLERDLAVAHQIKVGLEEPVHLSPFQEPGYLHRIW